MGGRNLQVDATSNSGDRHREGWTTTPASPFKKLQFPLNVYAHVQYLQSGTVQYLHFGLFREGRTDLAEAQQYSTDLLRARLPAAPCRVLEVGTGLGTTLALLQERGYSVTGITPDPEQAAIAAQRLAPLSSVVCAHFEDYEAPPASFDAIFLQESAQYIEPLVLFRKAYVLLRDDGILLILDEVALKTTEQEADALPMLTDLTATATRYGFELSEHVDLSGFAAPTVDRILQMTVRYRARLLQDLGLSERQLDDLERSNRTHREKYGDGRYGYALLSFRKAHSTGSGSHPS